MSTIKAIQFIGPNKVCILEDGTGVEHSTIVGEAIKNANIELINNIWTVTGAGDVTCNT